jgi:hypothetical protein
MKRLLPPRVVRVGPWPYLHWLYVWKYLNEHILE